MTDVPDPKNREALRCYFAAHAPPEIPAWFECRQQIENGTCAFLLENQYFQWRWHYADQMLAEMEFKAKENET